MESKLSIGTGNSQEGISHSHVRMRRVRMWQRLKLSRACFVCPRDKLDPGPGKKPLQNYRTDGP